mmetsp:Transcript_8334/g.13944  ORF Transcript_8334/g.13944 Transcript_8334/m.13944 type:complete len:277 (+) Transcript_8334:33-863(+)
MQINQPAAAASLETSLFRQDSSSLANSSNKSTRLSKKMVDKENVQNGLLRTKSKIYGPKHREQNLAHCSSKSPSKQEFDQFSEPNKECFETQDYSQGWEKYLKFDPNGENLCSPKKFQLKAKSSAAFGDITNSPGVVNRENLKEKFELSQNDCLQSKDEQKNIFTESPAVAVKATRNAQVKEFRMSLCQVANAPSSLNGNKSALKKNKTVVYDAHAERGKVESERDFESECFDKFSESESKGTRGKEDLANEEMVVKQIAFNLNRDDSDCLSNKSN